MQIDQIFPKDAITLIFGPMGFDPARLLDSALGFEAANCLVIPLDDSYDGIGPDAIRDTFQNAVKNNPGKRIIVFKRAFKAGWVPATLASFCRVAWSSSYEFRTDSDRRFAFLHCEKNNVGPILPPLTFEILANGTAVLLRGDEPSKPPVPRNMRSVRYGHVWHHELKSVGLPTGGGYPNERVLSLINLPKDLTGQRVLDIGTFDGFYAFECANRGAAEVVALDHPNWGAADHPPESKRGSFEYARQILDTREVIKPIEAVFPYLSTIFHEDDPGFDLILFLGVFYHLKFEQAHVAFNAISRLLRPNGLLIVETSMADTQGHWPSITTYPAGFFHDATNYVAPNHKGILWLLNQAGFTSVNLINTWANEYCGPNTCRSIYHVRKGAFADASQTP